MTLVATISQLSVISDRGANSPIVNIPAQQKYLWFSSIIIVSVSLNQDSLSPLSISHISIVSSLGSCFCQHWHVWESMQNSTNFSILCLTPAWPGCYVHSINYCQLYDLMCVAKHWWIFFQKFQILQISTKKFPKNFHAFF